MATLHWCSFQFEADVKVPMLKARLQNEPPVEGLFGEEWVWQSRLGIFHQVPTQPLWSPAIAAERSVAYLFQSLDMNTVTVGRFFSMDEARRRLPLLLIWLQFFYLCVEVFSLQIRHALEPDSLQEVHYQTVSYIIFLFCFCKSYCAAALLYHLYNLVAT